MFPTKGDDESRPVTLYVEKIDTAPDIEHLHTRRVSVIDIELPQVQVTQLMEYLRARQTGPGSIRVRLLGRLIHS